MKKRVTIIDDDPDLRKLIAQAVIAAGYEVTTRSDGTSLFSNNEALSDLYILDIDLGAVSGLELCKKLKDVSKDEKAPIVILISAHPDARALAEEVCADDTLPKPFNSRELIKKISYYLPLQNPNLR
jgi:DNA-binding response OmpR family regulator